MTEVPVNKSGDRRLGLPGLTADETLEFQQLDNICPFDCEGRLTWTFEGAPLIARERRWLQLFERQQWGLGLQTVMSSRIDWRAPVVSGSVRATSSHVPDELRH